MRRLAKPVTPLGVRGFESRPLRQSSFSMRKAGAIIRLGIPRLACILLLAGMTAACVERKLLLRSDPPGAEVALDGRMVGVTPLEVPFVYYGTRRITMRLENHASESHLIDVAAPWYQLPVLDFAFEALVPWRLLDEREVVFVLDESDRSGPEGGEPGGRLVRRAEQYLRREGLR